jgi:predicted DNA-binding transcriptional regulator YafY
MPRLEYRLFEAMVYILEGNYPDARKLAEKFGCSRRTAERYLERIRLAVADELVYDKTRRGYCFAGGQVNLPRLRLSEGEAIALFLGGKLLEQCRGTPYREHVAEALRKLCTCLATDVTYADVVQPVGWVSFAAGPLRGEEQQVLDRFTRIHRAIQERESLRIVYHAVYRGGTDEREVDPYHLHLHGGAWYAFAHCHSRGEVRTFAIDRIYSLDGTGRQFDRPTDFSAEDFVADAFGIERGEPTGVAIRFRSDQARYIRERSWHSSQTLEELPGGDLILRLHVGGLGEVKRWVLSYGSGAEVLAPPELREAVRREVAGLAGVYG